MSEAHRIIHTHLECLAAHQAGNACQQAPAPDVDLDQRLGQWRDEDWHPVRMVLQQLHLIHRMLPEMHKLVDQLAPEVKKQEVTA